MRLFITAFMACVFAWVGGYVMPSAAQASECACGVSRLTPKAWTRAGDGLVVTSQSTLGCKVRTSFQVWSLAKSAPLHCHDLSHAPHKKVACAKVRHDDAPRHNYWDTGLFRAYRVKAKALHKSRVRIQTQSVRASSPKSPKVKLTVLVRVVTGWKKVWSGVVSAARGCVLGGRTKVQVSRRLRVWVSPKPQHALITFNALKWGNRFETRMIWVKLPAPLRAVRKRRPAKPPKWVGFCGKKYGVQYRAVDCSQESVTDISPLRWLTQLRKLALGYTHVFDLAPIAGLKKLTKLLLPGSAVRDATLRHLSRLTRLEELWLSETQISDAGLVHLKPLKQLRWLDLDSTKVTDVGLGHLAPLKRLMTLDLSGARITDAGLGQLAQLPNLEMLSINATQITDVGLPALQRLTRLQDLSLKRTKITPAGLGHLAGLKMLTALALGGKRITDAFMPALGRLEKLEQLSLERTRITDAGLPGLVRLKRLKKLDLTRTPITNAGLRHLVKCRGLQELNLRYTKITDAGLKHLADLKGLKTLDLEHTRVTTAGVRALKAANPTLEISR